jgi:hypothetical protein
MKQLFAAIIVAIFLAALIPMNLTSSSAAPTEPLANATGLTPIEGLSPSTQKSRRPASLPNSDLKGIDATPLFQSLVAKGAQPDTGNTWYVPVIDDFLGGWYYLGFEKVASGTHANIWVGLSPEVWPGGYQDYYDPKGPGFDDDEWHFYYNWSDNGYRFWPGYHDIIYGKNITYVLDQFDNNIHQKDTYLFGNYAYRPGPEGDGKIQILIFNIRDGLFWDPVNAPWFIEGYFWDFASNLNNANIIHIDTYQWYRRLGPSPQPDPAGYEPRPFEYEGTFAHEFQHLIHHDIDPDELSWVDEGLAQLAMYYCGYGFPVSDLEEYFAYWWDTSLAIWQGELSNYGIVFLWSFYMYEHYGGRAFIWDLIHEQANGIAGYNNVLAAHGFTKTFDDIFQDWAIANYIDDTSFAGGIYGYYALNIPSADTYGWSIPYSMAYWDREYRKFFNTMPQLEGEVQVGWPFPYGTTLPYTVNYVAFTGLGAHALALAFNGADYVGIFPHSPTHEWYSDTANYAWYRLKQTFVIPSTGAMLTFWTNYGFEQDWDYGYVEVHDLDTDQWYTLPGTKTVTTLINNYGTDNPNCPNSLEPTAYYDASRWNAFTGSSGGWYQEQMSLTPFAGHAIELYFTEWQDPAVTEMGWYIDDISIAVLGFSDNVESGPNGWTANNGWYITTGIVENDFKVNLIQSLQISDVHDGSFGLTAIVPFTLDDATETGSGLYPMINTKLVQYDSLVMIMALQPGFEHTFASTYRFYYQKLPWPILK